MSGPFEVEVRGVPADASEDDVRAFFSRAGAVAAVTLPAGEGGAAVVRFASDNDVREALYCDGQEFAEGHTIRVTRAAPAAGEAAAAEAAAAVSEAPREEATAAAAAERGTGRPPRSDPALRVVVRHLPDAATEKDVRDFFAAAGLETTDLYHEPRRGYAFAAFTDAAALEAALALNGTPLLGAAVVVERRRTREEQQRLVVAVDPDTRLVVRGVPAAATEEALREVFSAHGAVTDCYAGGAHGYAFVTYATPAEASAALAALNGAELPLPESAGGAVRVTVERREPPRVCHRCGQPGHVARACRAPPQHGGAPARGFGGFRGGRGGFFSRGRGGERWPERRGERYADYGRDDRRRPRDYSAERYRRRSHSRSPPRYRERRSRSPPYHRERRHSRSRSPPRYRERRYSRSRSPPRRERRFD